MTLFDAFVDELDKLGKEMYHGSPRKLKELRAGKGSQGIFLSHHKGTATFFVPSKKDIPGMDAYSSTNWGYKEWGKKKNKPFDRITITHNAKDLPKVSGESKGYIYSVDMKTLKKGLEKFKKNPGSSDIEMVYPGKRLPILKAEPHTVKWTAQYDRAHERRHGPAIRKTASVRWAREIAKGKVSSKNLARLKKLRLKTREVRRVGTGGEQVADLVFHPKHGLSVRKIPRTYSTNPGEVRAAGKWAKGRARFMEEASKFPGIAKQLGHKGSVSYHEYVPPGKKERGPRLRDIQQRLLARKGKNSKRLDKIVDEIYAPAKLSKSTQDSVKKLREKYPRVNDIRADNVHRGKIIDVSANKDGVRGPWEQPGNISIPNISRKVWLGKKGSK